MAVHPVDHGRRAREPRHGLVLHHYDNSLEQYGSRLEPVRPAGRLPRPLNGLLAARVVVHRDRGGHGSTGRSWTLLHNGGSRGARSIAFALLRVRRRSWRRHAGVGEDGGREGQRVRARRGRRPRTAGHPLGARLRRPRLPRQARPLPGCRRGTLRRQTRTWPSSTSARSASGARAHVVEHQAGTTRPRPSDATSSCTRSTSRGRWSSANDDLTDHGPGRRLMLHALERGLTLRDDSILVAGAASVAYFTPRWRRAFWPKVPVILESEHYGGSKDRGAWQDGSLYSKAIEDYHASYASIHWWPQEFLDANRDRGPHEPAARLPAAAGRGQWPDAVPPGGPSAVAWNGATLAPRPASPAARPAHAQGRAGRDRRRLRRSGPRRAHALRWSARRGEDGGPRVVPPPAGGDEARHVRSVRLGRVGDRDARRSPCLTTATTASAAFASARFASFPRSPR